MKRRIRAKELVVANAVGHTSVSTSQYVVERVVMSGIFILVSCESTTYLRSLNDVNQGKR